MRLLLTFIIAAIGTTDAFAAAQYDTNLHLELKSVGLERETFLYALNWAGAADAKAESEHYPSNRLVVDASLWFEDFKLRRADDDAKPDAIRKSFNRARDWLQANDYIREYENKIWFIDDPDGQDK